MHPRARTLLLAIVLASPAARADEPDHWKRLESMPREQRLHLSRTLERFDALPSGDRSAVRDLDAAIAKLDPDIQARYRVVLRRYHVWVNGLDDAQRKQLDAAPSAEAKLALVTKWRKAEREADDKARKNLIFGVPPGDLGTIPPFEMANALRVWFTLDDKEKAEIEKLEKAPQRIAALNRLAPRKGVVRRSFPEATEDALLDRLEADEKVKAVFQKWVVKHEKSPDPGLVGKKRAEQKKAGMYNPLHQLSESLYFIEHPPEKVTPAHLVQFEAQIPPWLRASLDPLPPEEARRRLTIIYRQVYPAGQEIPPPPKADPAKSKAAPKPATPKAAPALF